MLTYADVCSDAAAVQAALADASGPQPEVPPDLEGLLAWLTVMAEQLEV